MNHQEIYDAVRALDRGVDHAAGVELARQMEERRTIYAQCDQLGHVLAQHPDYQGCIRCVVCGFDDTGNLPLPL
jgi:hypothetical protein